ncbi:Type II secretion system F domain protein [Solidesulfovibrio fructosivorans JJ]]|uniref:General secretion pathway protein F n=1 Tax=Solidesulfovibrio fructosivorans JJ] TaxID=596151 RepID=E1K105_SOLFR|nr:type II secretion system F family protein [Solidesulfovibrio fructosivorans]EFL49701.1 Type II secretion system F domain protein [Solidesulfovibrio fructosivorans JJ]]
MPVYEYQAIDAAGKTCKGRLSADSQGAALRRLRAQGLYPKGVAEASGAIRRARRTGSRHLFFPLCRVSKVELAVTLRQLANLLSAGFPLLRAVTMAREQTRSKALAHVLAQVEERLKEGAALAQALEEHPGVFPHIQVGLVRAAEASGTLEIVMGTLAGITEEQLALRRKLANALTYPLIMLVVGLGVVLLLVTFVVPRITRIFADLKQELPLATVVLIQCSEFLQRAWPVLLALPVLGILAGRHALRTQKGRLYWDRMRLAIPVVGNMLTGFALTRFARMLGTVLRHGIPVPQALLAVTPVLGNVVLEQNLTEVRREVEEGVSLTLALGRKPRIPPLLVQMAAAGEAGGNLDDMLLSVSAMMENELVSRLTILTALFEPAMILLLGGGVCFIIMAVLLPIFEMSTLIH